MMFSRKVVIGSLFILISSLLSVHVLVGLNSGYAFSDFNFGAAGDWECNSNTGQTVTNIKGKGPERVFALGDYSYVSTATCWLDKISDIKTKTRIAIGNHEDDSDEGFSTYMSKLAYQKPIIRLTTIMFMC
jgi:hypothetical protein